MRQTQAPTPERLVTIDVSTLAEIVRTEVRDAVAQLLRESPAQPRQMNFERMAYFNASLESARYLTTICSAPPTS